MREEFELWAEAVGDNAYITPAEAIERHKAEKESKAKKLKGIRGAFSWLTDTGGEGGPRTLTPAEEEELRNYPQILMGP